MVCAIGLMLLAALALAGRRVVPGWGRGLALAALPLAGLAAGAYASMLWSGSPGRASAEADRTLLYAVCLVAAGALGFTPARLRMLLP